MRRAESEAASDDGARDEITPSKQSAPSLTKILGWTAAQSGFSSFFRFCGVGASGHQRVAGEGARGRAPSARERVAGCGGCNGAARRRRRTFPKQSTQPFEPRAAPSVNVSPEKPNLMISAGIPLRPGFEPTTLHQLWTSISRALASIV